MIFEGFDKTGKTTIKNAFNKATNFEHVLIDRGPWSCIFFDEVLRGNLPPDVLEKRNARFRADALSLSEITDVIVYCRCSEEDAKKRHKEHSEGLPQYFVDYENNANRYWQTILDNLVSGYQRPCTQMLNTSLLSIEDSVEAIKETIQQIRDLR